MLLNPNRVLMHPFVLGELGCGSLRQRAELRSLLQDLPRSNTAQEDEVLFFFDRQELIGRGIGYVDIHLLAAATLYPGTGPWARDKRLKQIASEQGLAFCPVKR